MGHEHSGGTESNQKATEVGVERMAHGGGTGVVVSCDFLTTRVRDPVSETLKSVHAKMGTHHGPSGSSMCRQEWTGGWSPAGGAGVGGDTDSGPGGQVSGLHGPAR